MAQMNISNTLYNDTYGGVIAFAEQLRQQLISWNEYPHVIEELGQDRPNLQNDLNALFLSVYEKFLTFLNDADATSSAINTWKEIERFLADYTDAGTLKDIVDQLNANIESRLSVVLENSTGSSTTNGMTQKAITDALGTKQDTITDLEAIRSGVTKVGYYECSTQGSDADKAISADNYILSTGGSMKVKMTNANTADNATLNINSTGAKALYYAGERASASNTWEAGETVEIYYDGTSFYANNVAGGSGSGDGAFDVSVKYPTSGVEGGNTYTLAGALAVLNANLSASKKKGGMSIKFIQSSDNKYVSFRYIGTSTTSTSFTTLTNWQGVDKEPVAGSRNLIESNAVAGKLLGVTGNLEIVDIDVATDVHDGYISADGSIVQHSVAKYVEVAVGSADKVRFIGVARTGSSATKCAFYDENDTVVGSVINLDTGQQTNYFKEYVIDVPEGAVIFKTCYESTIIAGLPSIFYCYLQTGFPAASIIESGAFDISKYNKNSYASFGEALSAVPQEYRRSGMSLKFFNSVTNSYVQYRYTLQYENTTDGNNAFVNEVNWQSTVEANEISPFEKSYINESKNRFNGKLLIKRKRVNPVYGTLVDDNSMCLYYLPVTPGDIVYFWRLHLGSILRYSADGIAAFKQNDVFDKNSSKTSLQSTYTVPNNIYKIGCNFSLVVAEEDNIIIIKNDNSTPSKTNDILYWEAGNRYFSTKESLQKIDFNQVLPLALKSTGEETIMSIAHGGLSEYYPLDTELSIIGAKKAGFTACEMDVQITSDGELVLYHDTNMVRVGGTSSQNIGNMTLAELQGFDYGSWKDSKFSGTPICTFENAVKVCKILGIRIWVDCKTLSTAAHYSQAYSIVKKWGMEKNIYWLTGNFATVWSVIPDAKLVFPAGNKLVGNTWEREDGWFGGIIDNFPGKTVVKDGVRVFKDDVFFGVVNNYELMYDSSYGIAGLQLESETARKYNIKYGLYFPDNVETIYNLSSNIPYLQYLESNKIAVQNAINQHYGISKADYLVSASPNFT